jgi:UDP-3-O-acyl-N-acetylglucosamine deacetylase
MTIDRRDNEDGYVWGNVVKACVVCNMVKAGVLDEEEMRFVGPHLRHRLAEALGMAQPI